ncbi:conserved hypothetical protein [Rhodopirellula baltica SH 1]|uniref:Type II toxin-antitoxin system RelE/ParE family toxin n=2 Tax=Rhodopirellula baltica TaxID=265606 RepID=Q7UT85_RHOBA|nr:conserved hypothetical protein [Rhodopirellula baltica SH 1]
MRLATPLTVCPMAQAGMRSSTACTFAKRSNPVWPPQNHLGWSALTPYANNGTRLAMQVSWTEYAVSDLLAIRDYIGRDSDKFADLIFERIVEQTERLLEYPDAGSIVPEFGREDVSEIQVNSYRVVHQIFDDEVRVLTVSHATAPSAVLVGDGP